MTSEEEQHEIAHRHVSDLVLNALQQGFNEIKADDESCIISSFVTIVELIDGEGKQKLSILYNDERITSLLGLMSYGSMWVAGTYGNGMQA